MRNRYVAVLLVLVVLALTALSGGCAQRPATPEQTRFTPNKTGNPAEPVKFQTSKAQAVAGLIDLLGLQPNRRWIYKGTGDKAASYEVDLTFSNGTLYQLEENRMNAVTTHVIELRADGAYEILVQPGAKSRTNLLGTDVVTKRDKSKDVKILPWPVRKGTKWTLPSGAESRVVSTAITRTVPYGKQRKVAHVMTKPGGPLPGTSVSGTPGSNQSPQTGGSTLVAKQVDNYYAPKAGLIETRYSLGKATVTSKLNRITTVLEGTPPTANVAPNTTLRGKATPAKP